MGITLGASVRGVIELEKGDQLYFMVGQAGTDACVKVRNVCQPKAVMSNLCGNLILYAGHNIKYLNLLTKEF